MKLVPEDRQLPHHMHRQVEDVSHIAQDGEEIRRSQLVAEVGGKANSRTGETFNCHEGWLGIGQLLGEVGGRC